MCSTNIIVSWAVSIPSALHSSVSSQLLHRKKVSSHTKIIAVLRVYPTQLLTSSSLSLKNSKATAMDFIKAQLSKIPAITPVNLSACTVLITGSNTGLGLEAAREFLPSKPKRLILAVRNIEKGNEAKRELDKSKAASTQIEVRKLDQGSFASVLSFAKGLKGDRVDLAILNAGEFRPWLPDQSVAGTYF